MVSTFTPNINLEEPARNDDVGTWDTPVNSNMTLIDLTIGGVTTISLNNSPVVLNAAQFKSNVLVFNSTLTGNCAITFPTSFIKPYTIRNACTGSSAFVITMLTTASATSTISAPPGESVDVYNDGTSLNYRSLGRVGSYWDHGGSSLPAWVSACTVAPYLNCDGSAFSATTFPTLAAILGSTTLPDSRGRFRAALVQGTTRLTSAVCGFAPATVGAAGGDQSLQAHNHSSATGGMSANTTHTHTANAATIGIVLGGGGPGQAWAQAGASAGATFTTDAANIAHTHTIATDGAGSGQNIPPAYMGGITMIRAG